VRWNLNTDTPLPPDEPAGQNPPDGAMIDFRLKADAADSVTLEILDDAGKLVRRFSSADKPEQIDEKEYDMPTYWMRQTQTLSAKAGTHRFVWDLHYPPPEGPRQFPIAATPHDTASTPLGPWILPGRYRVRLTVAGKSMEQPLAVHMDPRIKTPADVLRQQFALSMQCYGGVLKAREATQQVRKLRVRLKELSAKGGPLVDAVAEWEQKAAALEGSERRRRERPAPGPREPSLSRANADLLHLLELLQGADVAPTSQAIAACEQAQKSLETLLSRWQSLREKDVKELDEKLRKSGQPGLAAPGT